MFFHLQSLGLFINGLGLRQVVPRDFDMDEVLPWECYQASSHRGWCSSPLPLRPAAPLGVTRGRKRILESPGISCTHF